jgi:hypothetical protein
MGHEMREYIDTFKKRITENFNISEDSGSFSFNDLKRAFEAGRRMSWTDINQEEQEPYYYSFEEWFDEIKSK